MSPTLKSNKIDCVIVPGGCTKYIQAPDVSWNKPFKVSCTEKYNEWLATVGIHEETAAGNLKAPPRKTILQWILVSEIVHKLCIKRSSWQFRRWRDSLFQGGTAVQQWTSRPEVTTGYSRRARNESFPHWRIHVFWCWRGMPDYSAVLLDLDHGGDSDIEIDWKSETY